MSVMPLYLLKELASQILFFIIGTIMPKQKAPGTKPCKIMPVNRLQKNNDRCALTRCSELKKNRVIDSTLTTKITKIIN